MLLLLDLEMLTLELDFLKSEPGLHDTGLETLVTELVGLMMQQRFIVNDVGFVCKRSYGIPATALSECTLSTLCSTRCET